MHRLQWPRPNSWHVYWGTCQHYSDVFRTDHPNNYINSIRPPPLRYPKWELVIRICSWPILFFGFVAVIYFVLRICYWDLLCSFGFVAVTYFVLRICCCDRCCDLFCSSDLLLWAIDVLGFVSDISIITLAASAGHVYTWGYSYYYQTLQGSATSSSTIALVRGGKRFDE